MLFKVPTILCSIPRHQANFAHLFVLIMLSISIKKLARFISTTHISVLMQDRLHYTKARKATSMRACQCTI